MPRPRKNTTSTSHDILEMALIGYESAKESIETKIAEITKMIGGSVTRSKKALADAFETAAPVKKRRKLSSAARKAISAAQKKRWQAARAATEIKPAVKRKAKAVKAKVKAAVTEATS